MSSRHAQSGHHIGVEDVGYSSGVRAVRPSRSGSKSMSWPVSAASRTDMGTSSPESPAVRMALASASTEWWWRAARTRSAAFVPSGRLRMTICSMWATISIDQYQVEVAVRAPPRIRDLESNLGGQWRSQSMVNSWRTTRSVRASTSSANGRDVTSNPSTVKNAMFDDDSGVVRDR